MNNDGLTLIELMVIMAILFILYSFSLLGYNSWVKSHKIRKTFHEVFNMVLYARNRSFLTAGVCKLCWISDNKTFVISCDGREIERYVSDYDFSLRLSRDAHCIEFDNGLSNTLGSIILNVNEDLPYNCIKVHWLRIRKDKCGA